MNMNTEPSGWSKREIESAKRIADRTGKTVEDVQRDAIRRHVSMSGRGSLYRLKIV